MKLANALLGPLSVVLVLTGCGSMGATQTAGALNSPGEAASGSRAEDADASAPLPRSALSGLPEPDGKKERPSGPGAHPRVLSWAGFRGAATYTFDDSQPSQIENWSALKALDVPFTFYVNPTGNWFAGYDATFAEARKLGHELGNHTMAHCHADLKGCTGVPPLLPAGSPEEELSLCNKYIIETLGQSAVWTVAYPYGDTGWKAPSEPLFLLGRGVSPGHIAPKDSTNPFLLPVFAAKGGESADDFGAELRVAAKNGTWVIFLLHAVRPTTYAWYAPVELTSLTKSIATAKASRELWLDSLVRVGSYWVAEKLLTDAIEKAGTSATTWRWTLPPHFPPHQYLRVVVDGGSLVQNGKTLPWDAHGYYEVALDEGALSWTKTP